MRFRLNQLTLPLDYVPEDVRAAAARELGCAPGNLKDIEVVRRSVDARSGRREPVFVLSVELQISAEALPRRTRADVQFLPDEAHHASEPLGCIDISGRSRPVIVGAGPAGLIAALTLAEAGLAPLVIERGVPAEERAVQVTDFWNGGELDAESNVLFGEGGAGLFSDGKLTARGRDRSRVRRFLETLVGCGAPCDILIDAEPHLGSDVLTRIVPRLRGRIESAGGEVRFRASLEDLRIERNVLRGVVVNGQDMETDACILATGHSARDVYQVLARADVPLGTKPFAVGLRLELPQERIDRTQWGRWAGHPRLGAANFRLTRKKDRGARACYTFCMCPGGIVIACASSPGELTTNGMSLSPRGGAFGNAAFLVPVDTSDYVKGPTGGRSALAGLAFQSGIERAAFAAGGSDYNLPAARLVDFLAGRSPGDLPDERSCARATPADLRAVLPGFACETLVAAIPKMLRKLRGVRAEEALLYAAETRSSSPVRVLRGDDGQSVGVSGLYPCGEGAGYAGGIVSSAVDGLRAAEALLHAWAF